MYIWGLLIFLISNNFVAEIAGQPRGDNEMIAINEVPYQVSIADYSKPNSPIFFCAGSILSEYYVITCSKCGHHQLISGMKVRSGSSSLYTSGSLHDVVSFTAYSYNSRSVSPAVIRVHPPIKFDETRRPINLPVSNNIPFDSFLKITVFRRKADTKQMALRQSFVRVVNEDYCISSGILQAKWNSEGSFCALNNNYKYSHRESGVPAVKDGTLIGISRGTYHSNCGIFISVPYYVDWIRYMMDDDYY